MLNVNVLVARTGATIECTVDGRHFHATGTIAEVLQKWTAFMDSLPAESRDHCTSEFALNPDTKGGKGRSAEHTAGKL